MTVAYICCVGVVDVLKIVGFVIVPVVDIVKIGVEFGSGNKVQYGCVVYGGCCVHSGNGLVLYGDGIGIGGFINQSSYSGGKVDCGIVASVLIHDESDLLTMAIPVRVNKMVWVYLLVSW